MKLQWFLQGSAFYLDSAPQCWENTRLRRVRLEGCEDRYWLTSWLFPCKALLCVHAGFAERCERDWQRGLWRLQDADGNQSTEHLAAVEVESPQPL